MGKKPTYSYQGEVWNGCVKKYGITAEQIADQFLGKKPGKDGEKKLAAAQRIIDGKFERLLSEENIARLREWYAMSEEDAKRLDAEMTKNYLSVPASEPEWFGDIDNKGHDPKKSDAERGQAYRDAITATTKDSPADIQVADSAVNAPEKIAPEKSTFAQRFAARPKPASEKENPSPPVKFKSPHLSSKEVTQLIGLIGKDDEELAKSLGVGVETLRGWKSHRYGANTRFAPAPHFIKKLFEEASIPLPSEEPSKSDDLTDKSRPHTHVRLATNAPVEPPHMAEEHDDADEVKRRVVQNTIQPPEDPAKKRKNSWGEKPGRQKKPEYDRELKGSGVAEFLSRRAMGTSARFFAGLLPVKSTKRAYDVLMGAPLTEDELSALDNHLVLKKYEEALLAGSGVMQLLAKRNLPNDAAPLSDWLGGVGATRASEVIAGAPLSPEEIEAFKQKMSEKKKSLLPSEEALLKSQPALSNVSPEMTQLEKLEERSAAEPVLVGGRSY